MISPLSVATGGLLGAPLAVASDGYLDTVRVTITPTPAAATGESGGKIRRQIPRPSWRDIELDRDDAEMVEILAILFTADIL